MELYEEIKDLVTKKEFILADEKMSYLLSMITPKYKQLIGKQFSFNHILEVYYYDYFLNHKEDVSHTDINLNAYYRLFGFLKMQLNKLEEAVKAYEMAISWNPVDLDSMLQLGELYKSLGNLDACKKITDHAYNFCCTRATLARYYRNLGFYYLEKYQPQIATALYQYSNIYYSSKQADNELFYLEKALKSPTPNLSIQDMQAILAKENIPVGPNSDTIGITYRVGQLELEKGNKDNARDCFTMVYDLTLDNEVNAILLKLQ